MSLAALHVEAFSDRAGAGNGAAVVRLETAADDAWLQAVAASLRQSETAFLLRDGERWLLRWFTPSCEVPLCGHATLAALLALGHWKLVEPGRELALHSRSGPLTVRLLRPPVGGRAGLGEISLPAAALQEAAAPAALEALLQRRLATGSEAFWRSALGYTAALMPTWADLGALAGLAPELPEDLRDGLVVMQPLLPGGAGPQVAGEPADYQLRFFAPGLGIPEDPVTGSAHALVAPWWMERLGRRRVVGWQCSDRPGGMVCEAASSATIRLIGSGCLLWHGTLLARPRPCDAASAASAAWHGLLCAD
ncbi:MAG: PhzF family phenazine biosynthesis protein [Synechococcaceae cyanobacterium]|nr:PhzF family phenazine biosynthesis protein [Synechococcaceae cyanobacterium]